MANPKTALAKGGLTRGKAAIIAVLSIVLIGVLYKQYGGPTEEEPLAAAAEDATVARLAPAVATAATEVNSEKEKEDAEVSSTISAEDETKWRIPELAEVVEFDPFALPPAFPQPAATTVDSRLAEAGLTEPDADALAETLEKLQTQLKELQQRGVHVIVKQRDQYVALIGDRMLHVGDEINGFTVTAIGPSGVSVEQTSTQ